MVEHAASYDAQVALLLRCLPALRHTPQFALKGGTAINLFVDNMPRLSVDIDLAYLPTETRDKALPNIEQQLNTLREHVFRTIPDVETP
jgi:predicted nucleotidyltransferase component of viral defense system